MDRGDECSRVAGVHNVAKEEPLAKYRSNKGHIIDALGIEERLQDVVAIHKPESKCKEDLQERMYTKTVQGYGLRIERERG